MTSEHSVLMTPHSAYMRHTLHSTWHHIHSITPNHSIYDVTSTSGMISHPLYPTLHPLYLFHHNLSTDITPSFEWHHTHLLCDIICTMYNVTSSLYVITLLYLCHQNLYIWNDIQYVGQHIHYTWDLTATICVLHRLYSQHHTHSLYDITLYICVASFVLYKTSHAQFMTSNHRVYVSTTMFDIVPTLSVSSHPLYSWYHTNFISEITSAKIHDIISLVYGMTATVWHHNHGIHDITFPTYDITSRVYDISSPYMWHHSHYVCEYMSTIRNIKHRVLRQYNRYMWNHNFHICICVITQTVSMI